MLSDIFSYLLAQEKSPGEPLCTLGAAQIEVLAFPPGQTVTLTVVPGEGEYAYIMHYTNFDPGMVPRAFQAYGQQLGARIYEGIVNTWLTTNHVDTLVVMTKQQGNLARVQNLTPLNQYYSGIGFWLVVKTEEDYRLVRKALERYSTSVKQEALLGELNQLIKQLIMAVKSPAAPMGRP